MKIKAIAIISASLLVLTGCASKYSEEEALAVPYSVVQTSKAPFTNESTFSYVNNEGDLIPLPDCGWPGLFQQRYCMTETGSYTFKYTTKKHGRLGSATLAFDGKIVSLKCLKNSDGSNLNICIPIGEPISFDER